MTGPNGQCDSMATMGKHSVIVSGHRTSVSVEDPFWNRLVAIARRRGISVNTLVAGIDRARSTNLSSAIRVFVLEEVDRNQTP